jgi:hypothetical protein
MPRGWGSKSQVCFPKTAGVETGGEAGVTRLTVFPSSWTEID